MRGLHQFLNFDFDSFADGKVFLSGPSSDWLDRASGEVLGVKVSAIIWQDNTTYKSPKSGMPISNQFEKIVFKIAKRVSVPPNVQIKPIHPVATVFGEFQNQLSVVCDDVEIISKR